MDDICLDCWFDSRRTRKDKYQRFCNYFSLTGMQKDNTKTDNYCPARKTENELTEEQKGLWSELSIDDFNHPARKSVYTSNRVPRSVYKTYKKGNM